ncbi:Eukaryotic translation initiation factor 2 subunit gamma [Verticillium dahliae VDG2]|nr:Eukaryotic translation initiation factor 2 subunit gamma [Verticillium dahliae VDG2]
MNSAPIFRFAQLSLSAGIPRTTVRNGHTWSRRRTAKPELSNFAPGHGEQIWVWHHLTSHQIIYSHTPQLDSNHALKQLPFIAKKSTPAKLRKDLWRPMALIQFPAGAGTAGQSAFQKLREYRRRHELEWGDEKLFRTREDAATGRLRTLVEAGGQLRGKRWSTDAPKEGSADRQLLEATVFWRDQQDKNFASEWSANVKHELFEDAKALQGAEAAEVEQVVDAATPVAKEA